MLKVCEEILNRKIPIEIAERRQGEPSILYADTSKVKNILAWIPQKTLQDSISSAYEWEKKLNNL